MSKENEVLLNEDIRAREVRCVGDDGTAYGVISRDEALEISNKLGLDLVLIAPDAKPPVCKIMDYGKFRYQQDKKLCGRCVASDFEKFFIAFATST